MVLGDDLMRRDEKVNSISFGSVFSVQFDYSKFSWLLLCDNSKNQFLRISVSPFLKCQTQDAP